MDAISLERVQARPAPHAAHLNLNVRGLGATLAINEQSSALQQTGRTVFRLGLGQSPFPVPDSVVEALKANAHQKDYLPVRGLPARREGKPRPEFFPGPGRADESTSRKTLLFRQVLYNLPPLQYILVVFRQFLSPQFVAGPSVISRQSSAHKHVQFHQR